MQETKRIGLELWIGLWAIAGLTAWCLALVGAGWHHLLIGLVAFTLAYAPVRISAEIARRRASPAAATAPLAAVADGGDDDGEDAEVDVDVDVTSEGESSSRLSRQDVDRVA